MIYDTPRFRWTAAALFALLFMMAHPVFGAADHELTRFTKEVQTRVDKMEAAIAEAAAAAGVAEAEVDVSAIPGRASFIAWALDMMDALEQAGYLTSDEVFLAETESAAALSAKGCRAAMFLFRTLGRLRAEEATAVLSRFMLTQVTMVFHPDNGKIKSACGALTAIGQPALPVLLSKAREADHPRLTKVCAYVIGTILGEEGPEWLDRQIALEKDVVAKPRLEAMTKEIELCAWQARWEREKADKKAAREAQIRKQQLANEVFE